MSGRHGLEIRAATAADAPGLAELLAAADRPVPARSLAERLDRLRHDAGTVLVALDWGPPSGLVVLHWYATLHQPLRTAQITGLLVAAGDRRRGIARLLVKAASQAARVAGCGALEMLVDADPALRPFCLATGFTGAGERYERVLRKGLTVGR